MRVLGLSLCRACATRLAARCAAELVPACWNACVRSLVAALDDATLEVHAASAHARVLAAAVAAAAGTPQTIFYVSPNVSTFDILLLYSYIVWYIIVKRRTAEYVMSAGFSGHRSFTYYLDV